MSLKLPQWISNIFYNVDKNKDGITQEEIDALNKKNSTISSIYTFEVGMNLESFVSKNKSIFQGYIHSDNTSDTQTDLYTSSKKTKTPKYRNRTKELKAWKLEFSYNIDQSGFEDWEYFKDKNKDEKVEIILNRHMHKENVAFFEVYNKWYPEYLKNHNNEEMNFITAMQYLKDNPDEKWEVKEFIKRSFCICDGDVSNNKQMGLGTCSLLSCREKMGDDQRLNDITENIVKQNMDGTVTVTFFGIRIKDDNGDYKPIQFTFKNEELKAFCTNLNLKNDYEGVSTDPDSAALEMAWEKLSEYLNKILPNENNINALKAEFEEANSLSGSIYNNLRDEEITIIEKYLRENASKLKEEGKAQNLLEQIDYNSFSNSNRLRLLKFMHNNPPEMWINEIISLNLDIDCNKIQELIKQNIELRCQRENLSSKIESVEQLERFCETPCVDERLTILTGMGNYVKGLYNFYEFDDYFKSINYNVDEKCIIAYGRGVPGMLEDHAYMVEEIYEDKNGKKYITFKNPHNIAYHADDELSDEVISGNPGNTFTVPYDRFSMRDLTIVALLEEPAENKKEYYKFPDDFLIDF